MSRYTAVPSREIGPASSDSEAEALLPSHLAIAPVHTLGVKCSEPLFHIVMLGEARAAYVATPSHVPGGALEAGPDLIQTQNTLQRESYHETEPLTVVPVSYTHLTLPTICSV